MADCKINFITLMVYPKYPDYDIVVSHEPTIKDDGEPIPFEVCVGETFDTRETIAIYDQPEDMTQENLVEKLTPNYKHLTDYIMSDGFPEGVGSPANGDPFYRYVGE